MTPELKTLLESWLVSDDPVQQRHAIHRLAWGDRIPDPPDPDTIPLAESLVLFQIVNLCPYRSRDAACGCTGNRCGLRRRPWFPTSIAWNACEPMENLDPAAIDPQIAEDETEELVDEVVDDVQQRLWLRAVSGSVEMLAKTTREWTVVDDRVAHAVDMAIIAACERIGRLCRSDLEETPAGND